tara:strand:+ start:391 stop:711 length:321 start_codon:yes stop_codon:yes gene_type:complete
MLSLEEKLAQVKSYPKSELVRNLENEILIVDSLTRENEKKQRTIGALADAWGNKNDEFEASKAETRKLQKLLNQALEDANDLMKAYVDSRQELAEAQKEIAQLKGE